MNWLNTKNIVLPLLAFQAIWLFGLLEGLNVGLLDSFAGIKFSTAFAIIDAGVVMALWKGYM